MGRTGQAKFVRKLDFAERLINQLLANTVNREACRDDVVYLDTWGTSPLYL